MHSLLLILLSLSASVIAAPAVALEARQAQPTPTRTFASTGSLLGPTTLRGYHPSLPLSTEDTVIPIDKLDLAPGQIDDKIGALLDFSHVATPQPVRGSKGNSDPGPKQPEIDRTHPDILAPPQSDTGDVPQLNWPMDLSHVKLGMNNAGWSRQQNLKVMPIAKEFAGVDMRLGPGAYRELHWHTSGEWAYIVKGNARIGAINEEGQSFFDDLTEGDVWFFPPGIPHYIQGLDTGVEFLLIFDDGNFSEDETFLVSEMFARTPTEVWSKELDLPTEAFANLPGKELFIFNGTEPPKDLNLQNVIGPAGSIPDEGSYSYHWSQQKPLEVPGGTVKILDTNTFPIASDFSTAIVTVKPGAIREVHWHPSSDEWSYFIQGHGRMSVFVAPSSARTFDFNPGDVGYVPQASSHYVENIGDTDLIFLEVLKQKKFTDVSAGQWLGLTPPQVLKDTLHLSDESIAHLYKEKPLIIQGLVPSGTASAPAPAASSASAAPAPSPSASTSAYGPAVPPAVSAPAASSAGPAPSSATPTVGASASAPTTAPNPSSTASIGGM
ncbi:RmlC-like cupin domain-containing protein [Pyronema domesticum]|nr:RmlC-like cupin domain-containing protein [Pyronema domesticum]